ncbi:MAG: Maf family protein [Armatimonadota bacterium]|nr:Maf family protein [Armatimonadota bacterium]MDR7422262.1 Maf family protein [Armatimonadota bacterium]MDR7454680.1 Maf family protein [Armatimonadota bacterium]MDR7456315.1 Maf family protein [Armatimonadota bacterium]MDR7496312.1 Maf family protein [Armatimonadota bacterium]
MPQLVLASASPRRAELLRQVGLDFTVWPSGAEDETRGVVPERPTGGGPGWTLDEVRARARQAALEKARAVAASRPDAIVVAADTMVVADGVVLGKPQTPAEAVAMLRLLSGRSHHVATGLAVVWASRAVALAEAVTTLVQFRPLADGEIHRYVATGEPMDKAGGYGIQGRAALFVERVDGDYFAVVGLPLARLARLLDRVGMPAI